MKFSIIVIIKDDPKILELVLASYVALDYPKALFELIVVDDGSLVPLNEQLEFPDSIQFNYLYLPRNEKSSRARARNQGAALANYPYLIFIDGDHFVKPTLLKNYKRYFTCKPKRQLVLGTRNEIPPHHLGLLLNQYKKTGLVDPPAQVQWRSDIRLNLEKRLGRPLEKMRGKWHLFWSCNFCIKKELFLSYSFDENFLGWGLEDVELGYRLFEKGVEFEMLNNPVWHLTSPQQLSKSKYSQWLENIQFFFLKHKDKRILEQQSFADVFFFEAGLGENRPLDWISIFSIFEEKMQFHEKN